MNITPPLSRDVNVSSWHSTVEGTGRSACPSKVSPTQLGCCPRCKQLLFLTFNYCHRAHIHFLLLGESNGRFPSHPPWQLGGGCAFCDANTRQPPLKDSETVWPLICPGSTAACQTTQHSFTVNDFCCLLRVPGTDSESRRCADVATTMLPLTISSTLARINTWSSAAGMMNFFRGHPGYAPSLGRSSHLGSDVVLLPEPS